jgi:hypothetical protein
VVERDKVITPQVTYDWLLPQLKLCQYPLIRRPPVGELNRQQSGGGGAGGCATGCPAGAPPS